MDFDKDVRRMYRRENRVAKISLLMLFVFCIVGLLLGIVFIHKNLDHRIRRVETALLSQNAPPSVEGKGMKPNTLSPSWGTSKPVTMPTTKGPSQEESLMHDLKKQGHSIKAKLDEIDKKILNLNPRVVQEKKQTKQKPLEQLKKTQDYRIVKNSSKTGKAHATNQRENLKITRKPKRKEAKSTKTKRTLFRKLNS